MPNPSLTQSPLLARNTLLNLLGYGAPLLVAIFAIPVIVSALGTARFGILTLTWVLIGYLSLLDLGLGRALTKLVAEKLGEGATEEIPSLIWTALSGMVLLSIVVSLMLGLLSGWMVNDILKIPEELKQEAQSAFLMLIVFVPVVIISVGFRGVLEAYQRFDMVNAVRIPLGVFSFAIPLVVIPFTVELPPIIFFLFLGRLAAVGVQFLFCCRIVSGMLTGLCVRPELYGNLLRFGSWMTVTNAVHPLLVYSDRFFIGSLVSVTAVAFYATPSEVVTQLTLISGAFAGVMFPAFSASFTTQRARSAFLLDRSLKYVALVVFPLVFVVVCFAYEGLYFWLDAEFAQKAYRVSQMLAVGVFFTCLGQMPFAFIQGAGRPDLTGKLHLCQLPVQMLLVVKAVQWSGINGAALIWALRAMVDCICLFWIAQNLLESDRLKTIAKLPWLLSAMTLLGAFALMAPLNLRLLGFGIVMVGYVLIGLRFLLSPEEITFLRRLVDHRHA